MLEVIFSCPGILGDKGGHQQGVLVNSEAPRTFVTTRIRGKGANVAFMPLLPGGPAWGAAPGSAFCDFLSVAVAQWHRPHE